MSLGEDEDRDQDCLLGLGSCLTDQDKANLFLIGSLLLDEIKRPSGKMTPEQSRMNQRLALAVVIVIVVALLAMCVVLWQGRW